MSLELNLGAGSFQEHDRSAQEPDEREPDRGQCYAGRPFASVSITYFLLILARVDSNLYIFNRR